MENILLCEVSYLMKIFQAIKCPFDEKYVDEMTLKEWSFEYLSFDGGVESCPKTNQIHS